MVLVLLQRDQFALYTYLVHKKSIETADHQRVEEKYLDERTEDKSISCYIRIIDDIVVVHGHHTHSRHIDHQRDKVVTHFDVSLLPNLKCYDQ